MQSSPPSSSPFPQTFVTRSQLIDVTVTADSIPPFNTNKEAESRKCQYQWLRIGKDRRIEGSKDRWDSLQSEGSFFDILPKLILFYLIKIALN